MSESAHSGPEQLGAIMSRYDFSDMHGNNPERSPELVRSMVADAEIDRLYDERESLRAEQDDALRRQQARDNGQELLRAYARRLDPNYTEK